MTAIGAGPGGMQPEDPLGSGFDAGFQRAEMSDLIPSDLSPDMRARLSDELAGIGELLQSYAPDVSDRFLAFFSEMITVAAIAREQYGEPPLDPGTVEEFLHQARGFLNSFSHR